MNTRKQQEQALFRFGVIASLVGVKKTSRGQTKKILQEITHREWLIPGSGRSYISKSTVLEWLRRYEVSGRDLKSLYPKQRQDKGRTRSMDKETELALINLKKELGPHITLPVVIDIAKRRNILPSEFKTSWKTVYRLFKRHGLDEDTTPRVDRRKFEAELPNDLWQADAMHGPCVLVGNKKRKAYLFAIIDDHSRLIMHAQFYPNETLESFLDCFRNALLKRGLPRKLYLDNGPSFRAHQLKFLCASLGIELIHSKAYVPQGKGKIERWFKSVRMRLLPLLKKDLTLEKLNECLEKWLLETYQSKTHNSIGEAPLLRFTKHIELIRQAPNNLNDYFRKRIQRKVAQDRTVSVDGKLFEAPVGLMGKTVTLFVCPNDVSRIEVFYQDKSFGFLTLLDVGVNSRIKRSGNKNQSDNKTDSTDSRDKKQPPPQSGRLFG